MLEAAAHDQQFTDNPLSTTAVQPGALSISGMFDELDLDHSGQVDFTEFEYWWREIVSDATNMELFRRCFEIVERRPGASSEPGVNVAEFEEIVTAVAVGGWLEQVDPQTGEREWKHLQTKETSLHDPAAGMRAAALDQFLIEVAAKARAVADRTRVLRRTYSEDVDEFDETTFVPLPTFDFGGRLGPWLSTAEGAPTRLSKAVYLWTLGVGVLYLFFGMDGRGVFNKLGCENKLTAHDAANMNFSRVGGCDLDAVADVYELFQHACICIYLCGTGVPTFHSLRMVTRRGGAGGQLHLLGAHDARISPAASRSLLRWAWSIRVVGGTVSFLFCGFAFYFFTMVPWPMNVAASSLSGYVGVNTFITGIWWLSLKRGSALGARRVSKVRRAVIAVLSARRMPDDVAWQATVESPALSLASTTLPLLTNGWGNALGATAVGWTAMAVYMVTAVASGTASGSSGVLAAAWVLAFFLAAMPVMMAYTSRQISRRIATACARSSRRCAATFLRRPSKSIPCTRH